MDGIAMGTRVEWVWAIMVWVRAVGLTCVGRMEVCQTGRGSSGRIEPICRGRGMANLVDVLIFVGIGLGC